MTEKGNDMPTKTQLNDMANQLGLGEFDRIPGTDAKVTVMKLAIAAMQASALRDMAYTYGFKG